jgi:hypothetical protein
MLFKVLAGRHIDENDMVYYKGDTVESNVNLCDLFANKFERNLQAEIDAERASIPVPAAPAKSAKKVKTPEKEDVSSEFPEAGPNNIRVEKDAKGYWVIDTDNKNTKPSNKKALELEDVVPFIDSLLE